MSKFQELFNKALANRSKQLAVLIDPDKVASKDLGKKLALINAANVDYIFVGGSLLVNNNFDEVINQIKSEANCPVIIFPGHPMQVSNKADALLLLSLISGRNPELLIGQHVHAAPFLKESGIELMPTGYLLIDSQQPTSVSYMSNTLPIPNNKPDIAAYTALAGEQLGLKNIYLEAGSGARQSVSVEMVAAVRKQISIPLLVGGGIRDASTAISIAKAGADVIVVGSAIEKNAELITQLADSIHNLN